MSSFIEVMYFVCFFAMLGLTLFKIYNSLTGGDKYPITIAWFLFIGFLFAYGIGFFMQILSVDDLNLVTLQSLAAALLGLQVLFLIVEHLFFLGFIGQELTKPRGRYNAKEIQEKL